MSIKRYVDFIAEQHKKMEVAGLVESAGGTEDKKVTNMVTKKYGDVDHVATHGTQHVYALHDSGSGDTASYAVHDTATKKTHPVDLDFDWEKVSHKEVQDRIGSKQLQHLTPGVTKSIHKHYSKYAGENSSELAEAKSASGLPKGDHPFKTYPPEHNMHLETAEGDEHHVIQGIKHTQENADHVFDKINKAGAKIAKMSTREFEAINGDTPFHHTLLSRNSLGAGDKPTKVHKSVEDYVKHHAPLDAAWVKSHRDEE